MIGARRGSPLAIGHGDGEMFFGSDAIALAPFTDRDHLSRGRRLGGAHPRTARRSIDAKRQRRSSGRWCGRSRRSLLVDKGNHRHFMAKEIYEQPEVVGHTLAHYLDFAAGRSALPADFGDRLRRARPAVDHRLRHRLLCRAGRQILVRALRPAAGRHRYRLRVPLPRAAARRRGGLSIVVSQSGETADTLASLRYAKAQGQKIAAVVNVRDIDHRARGRLRAADARRAGDRRRLDQGLHLPARGARLARRRGRARRAGTLSARGRGEAGRGAERGAAPA